MKLHDQYEVLWDDFKNEDLARIKLIGGKWDGLIYKYDTVSFLEQEDGDRSEQGYAVGDDEGNHSLAGGVDWVGYK